MGGGGGGGGGGAHCKYLFANIYMFSLFVTHDIDQNECGAIETFFSSQHLEKKGSKGTISHT